MPVESGRPEVGLDLVDDSLELLLAGCLDFIGQLSICEFFAGGQGKPCEKQAVTQLGGAGVAVSLELREMTFQLWAEVPVTCELR